MNKFYLISPDDKGWSSINPYDIIAGRACGLPGVQCHVCKTTWATTGIIYPTISCEFLSGIVSSVINPVQLNVYQQLVSSIYQRLGNSSLFLKPGAEFGPLQGTINGELGDFAWVNPWTPLVRTSVYKYLLQKGLKLTGVEAILKFKKSSDEPFIEIEARPVAKLHAISLSPLAEESCDVCGRRVIRIPDRIVLDQDWVDRNLPIQRIICLPTYLIVNENMADIILSMKLRDVLLEEVTVV